MIDIEAHDPQTVDFLVRKHGYAIWRGLFPPDVLHKVIESVGSELQNLTSYASVKNGAMKRTALNDQARAAQESVGKLGEVFTHMLGGPYKLDDEASPVFIAAQTFTPLNWHQDNVVLDTYTAMVWVAASDCGVNAPGLELVLHNPGKAVALTKQTPTELSEELGTIIASNGWPIIYPKFKAGDAVFSNNYSLHRTHRTEKMKRERIAFKLSAIRV